MKPRALLRSDLSLKIIVLAALCVHMCVCIYIPVYVCGCVKSSYFWQCLHL